MNDQSNYTMTRQEDSLDDGPNETQEINEFFLWSK